MAGDNAARRIPWRLVAWLLFVLSFAALNYASRQGLFGDVEVPDDAAFRYSTSVGAVFQYAITVGILLLIARGLPKREVFALRRPDSWAVGAGLVVAGYLAILVVGGVLGLFLNATEEQGLVPDDWDSSRAGAFIAFFLTVTVLGPVVEELTYRGLGFGLLAPYGAAVAVTVTAVLFGVGHGLLIALPVLTAFGFVLGFLRARTGSIYPPMILHGIFNGIALIVSLAVLD